MVAKNDNVKQALDIIEEHVKAGNIVTTALFSVTMMKKGVENHNPEQLASGMTVEYADGTTDVFYGDATDPYFQSDWAFYSATDYTVLKGYQYSTHPQDYDDATQGRQSIRKYAQEMDEMLVGSRPRLAEGPDIFLGKQVVRVIVL